MTSEETIEACTKAWHEVYFAHTWESETGICRKLALNSVRAAIEAHKESEEYEYATDYRELSERISDLENKLKIAVQLFGEISRNSKCAYAKDISEQALKEIKDCEN